MKTRIFEIKFDLVVSDCSPEYDETWIYEYLIDSVGHHHVGNELIENYVITEVFED